MRGWLAMGLVAALGATAQAAERRELGRARARALEAEPRGRGDAGGDGDRGAGPGRPGLRASGRDGRGEGGGRAPARRPWPSRLSLFVLPAAAGCRVVEAAVGCWSRRSTRARSMPARRTPTATRRGASQRVPGRYTLDCADPGALTDITFAWFDRFPNAKEVEVTLVTAKGQTSFEVERGDPPLAIGTGILTADLAEPAPAAPVAAATAALALADVRFAWPGRRSFALEVDRFALERGERVLLLGRVGLRQVDAAQPGLRRDRADRRAGRGAGHRSGRRSPAPPATASARRTSASCSRCSTCCPTSPRSTMSCCRWASRPSAAGGQGRATARRGGCWRGWAWPRSRTSRRPS